ncbi:Phosphopantothenoylcysteine decarboxylase / Phosphopantothenoylcysteine synthetase [hydrothermal vent metagenome]|uniref:Phosphopantothenoylcysteine decarboxylase / Phosphopantothenoylcysteine synthetase n=1 Tax=hydrothermal vent metagenome TaxID=652676 RepID=A0A3B0YM83_9ZZZZ
MHSKQAKLQNKRILLGICGSIAAYKCAELVRQLNQAGASVRVVMTPAAEKFVTPLTLQALSGHSVRTELMDMASEAAMGHIDLARWADLILIAPATADFLARANEGRANDLLTALCLVSDVPVAVAPAMNVSMWNNQATQHNVKSLEQRGILFFGPDSGELACGEVGEGRMLAPEQLLLASANIFRTGLLQGISVMITAGPTREALDPVRYISNRSSGKMGYALAEAAVAAGAKVTLISGPVDLPVPDRVQCIKVVSAIQMSEQVMKIIAQQDIFIAAAAVADYQPAEFQSEKIKKEVTNDQPIQITLVKTPDIVQQVAQLKNDVQANLYVVGFAAETSELERNAREKMQRKNLDLIVANDVSGNRMMEQDAGELMLIAKGICQFVPKAHKSKLARTIMTLIAERYHAKITSKNTG